MDAITRRWRSQRRSGSLRRSPRPQASAQPARGERHVAHVAEVFVAADGVETFALRTHGGSERRVRGIWDPRRARRGALRSPSAPPTSSVAPPIGWRLPSNLGGISGEEEAGAIAAPRSASSGPRGSRASTGRGEAGIQRRRERARSRPFSSSRRAARGGSTRPSSSRRPERGGADTRPSSSRRPERGHDERRPSSSRRPERGEDDTRSSESRVTRGRSARASAPRPSFSVLAIRRSRARLLAPVRSRIAVPLSARRARAG